MKWNISRYCVYHDLHIDSQCNQEYSSLGLVVCTNTYIGTYFQSELTKIDSQCNQELSCMHMHIELGK